MSAAPHLDKSLLRRRFERIAAQYDDAAMLAREIGSRMSERLDLLRIAPKRVLDLGSGTGTAARGLRRRYPGCTVVELDFALAMLRQSRRSDGWWRRCVDRVRGGREARICADIERLPFGANSFDMVWSNLALQWLDDPQQGFTEVARVLRPGGVCLFSTLGPDTLKELRAAFAAADSRVHMHTLIDLHDYGDMLVQARLSDPVMDMEYLTLTFPDVPALLQELRASGAGNGDAGRLHALWGERAYRRMIDAYEARRVDGRVPATFEIVYGHAWQAESQRARMTADGHAVIEFHPRRSGPR